MNIVIDTNCLIVSIPQKNTAHFLYKAFRNNAFHWIISNDILLEYEEQITKFYSAYTANLVINILLTAKNVILQEPYYKWNLINVDPDDNKFVDLAISANANYLVTNDRHFNILKSIEFPNINIVTIQEFKDIIKY